jgi:hypothetical protein
MKFSREVMPLKMTSRVQAAIYVDIAARKSSSSSNFELFMLIVYFGLQFFCFLGESVGRSF